MKKLFKMNKIVFKPVIIRFNNIVTFNLYTKQERDEFLNLNKDKRELEFEYEDSFLEIRQKWHDLVTDMENKIQNFPCSELTEHQREKCNNIYDLYSSFNIYEKLYFEEKVNEHIEKAYDTRRGKPHIGIDNFTNLKLADQVCNDPNYFIFQNILYDLTPFLTTKYFLGANADVAASDGIVEAKQEQKVKEKPQMEKQFFNVKIASYDPSKKILIIKEVKSMLNLGLKESKELVDGVPFILKQNASKVEAEELKKKFEELKAEVLLE